MITILPRTYNAVSSSYLSLKAIFLYFHDTVVLCLPAAFTCCLHLRTSPSSAPQGYKPIQRYTTFKSCVRKELYSR